MWRVARLLSVLIMTGSRAGEKGVARSHQEIDDKKN